LTRSGGTTHLIADVAPVTKYKRRLTNR
jgi:hypothetical protein